MGGANKGEKPKGLFLDGGFRVGGGFIEAIEKHRDTLRGESLDDLLKVFNGDLVSVSVGKLR